VPAASVGLLVIATGRYLQFAEELFEDVARHLLPEASVTVNLFTDAPDEEVQALQTRSAAPINFIRVPPLRWPEASLYRYELFAEASSQIVGDVLVYLDSDIRIARPFLAGLTPERWAGGMAAVRHPGYYRRHGVRPRGAWETHKRSVAYVARWRRRCYVCGGVWMGLRDSVLAVSRELAERVRMDAAAGVTARWHDESHWNWWIANHKVHVLGPEYCWVAGYAWLAHLEPIVSAVDKGGDFVREETNAHTKARLTASAAPEADASRGYSPGAAE
jgi:hypothetical protein